MTLVLKDRVKEQTTTTGTGTVTLGGAVSGFESFSAVGNGNTTYYAIVHQTADEWEVGLGTYTAAGTLLSRDTILESTNSDAAVNFSAGTKDVFVTYPSDKAIYADGSGNVGIGTSSPDAAAKLDVNGQVLVRSTGAAPDTTPGGQYGFYIQPDSTGTVNLMSYSSGGSTDIQFFTNSGGAAAVNAMTIDSSGNVGIGTGSPAVKLDVRSSSSVLANFSGNNANNYVQMSDNSGTNWVSFGSIAGGNWYLYTAGYGALYTGGTERMRIDSSGNVGIGTSSVATNLHVYENTNNGTINNIALLDAGNQNPSVAGSGVAMDFRSGNGSSYFGAVGGYSDGTHYVAGLWGGAAASGAPDLAVTSGGNVGIGTTVTSLFNSVGGTTKLAVVGDSASTAVVGNTDASISIINKDGTLGNTAGLHFARADTDETPNYAGASIVAQFLAAQVTGQYPAADMNFLTATSQNSAPSFKMILTAAGRVGIGTSSPAQALDVVTASSNAYIRVARNALAAGQAGLQINGGTGGVDWYLFQNTGSSDLTVFGNGSERMRINSSGNVGINVSAPHSALEVNTVASTPYQVVLGNSGQTSFLWGIGREGVSTGNLEFRNTSDGFSSSTVRMSIAQSGNVGIGTSSPDFLLDVAGRIGILEGTNGIAFHDGAGSVSAGVRADSGDNLIFATGSSDTERMRIDGSGDMLQSGGGIKVSGSLTTATTNSISLDQAGTVSRVRTFGPSVGNAVTIQFEQSDSVGTPIRYPLVIDSSGNVGMGTTAPATFTNGLAVAGSGNDGDVAVINNTVGAWSFKKVRSDNSNAMGIYDPTGFGVMALYTAGSERMRITSSGNVGIGTTSPGDKLDVVGGNIRVASTNQVRWVDSGIIRGYATADTSGNLSLVSNGGGGTYVELIANGQKQFDAYTYGGTTANWVRATGGQTASPVLLSAEGSDTHVGIEIKTKGAERVAIFTNASERVRLDSSGKLTVNGTTGMGMLNAYASNWPQNALAIYSANVAGQTNYAGIAFNNQDTDATVGNVADIYTNPAGTLSLTSGANPAIQLKYGSGGISGGTPALTVDSSGKVGIGTTAPAQKLSIESTGGSSSEIDISLVSGISNKECILNFGKNLATADRYLGRIFYQVDNNVMGFWTNNAERMRIGSTGNVGIGTSSPAKQFEITKASRALIGTLTDGATITPDFDANQNFTVTLGGNRTLANPTNVDAGQTGSIFVVQDATGGRTLSFGSYWKFAGGTAPTLSTGTNAVDRIDYIVKSSTEIHAVASLNLS